MEEAKNFVTKQNFALQKEKNAGVQEKQKP